MTISPARTARAQPAELSNAQLHGLVFSPLASCAHSALDPDEWFPIATGIVPARVEAAQALAVCTDCPVRAECLELSLRHWAVVASTASGVAWSRRNVKRSAENGSTACR